MLGIALNPIFPTVPLGTLAANVAGGYLIGMAVEYFAQHAGLPPEVRLFIITGFLGGLTTFSTFSAEAVALLARAQYGWATVMIGAHLAGSLLATLLGMMTIRALTQG
jgi:CrcB protein